MLNPLRKIQDAECEAVFGSLIGLISLLTLADIFSTYTQTNRAKLRQKTRHSIQPTQSLQIISDLEACAERRFNHDCQLYQRPKGCSAQSAWIGLSGGMSATVSAFQTYTDTLDIIDQFFGTGVKVLSLMSLCVMPIPVVVAYYRFLRSWVARNILA